MHEPCYTLYRYLSKATKQPALQHCIILKKKTASQDFQKKTLRKKKLRKKLEKKLGNLNLKKNILKSKHKQRWHELLLSSQMVVL